MHMFLIQALHIPTERRHLWHIMSAAFKNTKAIFLSKLGGTGSSFRSDLKKISGGGKMIAGGLPRPDLTSLEVCGGTLMSPILASQQKLCSLD